MSNRSRLSRRRFLKKLLVVTAGGLAACQSRPTTSVGTPTPARTIAPARSEPSPDPTARQPLLYVGAYVEDDEPGIYHYRMDPASGALTPVGMVKAGANPSFLALPPTAPYLYAVNEIATFQEQPGGAVSAFAIDPGDGALTMLNRQPSHGVGPCHLTTDRMGRFLLVANYGDGTLSVYPLAAEGRIGAASQVVHHHGRGADRARQAGPHAHYIAVAPDNRFVLTCDLGIDKVLVYRFASADGQLSPHSEAALQPGSGPRHLDFHPNGRYVYVINELDATLTVFAYVAETGMLANLQTLSTLPEGYSGPKSSAEVCVHPSGMFVYASNRGHDSIAIYTVDAATGQLMWVGQESSRGAMPRSFAIDPSGMFLLVANQDSDMVASFRIDLHTGTLRYLQRIAVPKPACLKFRAALE